MRLDVRKSLTLNQPNKLTPSTNLLNPEWGKSFSDALKKLAQEQSEPVALPSTETPKPHEGGGRLLLPPEALRAAASEQYVREADFANTHRLPFPSTSKIQDIQDRFAGSLKAPQEQDVLNRLAEAGQRAPGLGVLYATGRLPTQSADLNAFRSLDIDKGVEAGTAAGHAGNIAAVLLDRARNFRGRGLLSGFANLALPIATTATVPLVSDHKVKLDMNAFSPDFRDAQVASRSAATTRFPHEGYVSDPNVVRDRYAESGDPYAGFRTPPEGLTRGQANALGASELAASAALFPNVGAPKWLVGGASAASVVSDFLRGAPASDTAANALHAGGGIAAGLGLPKAIASLNPAKYPLLTRAVARLPGAAALARVVPGARLALGPIGYLGASAVSGAHQLATMTDDEVKGRISEEGYTDRSGAGRLASTIGHTLSGSPVDAAAIMLGNDPEIREAAEALARGQRVYTAPRRDLSGNQIIDPKTGGPSIQTVDLDKVRDTTRQIMQDVNHLHSSELASIATRGAMQSDSLDYINSKRFKLTPDESQSYGKQIGDELSRQLGVKLLPEAYEDITKLVSRLGPVGATTGLFDDFGRSASIYLRSGWVPFEVHGKAFQMLPNLPVNPQSYQKLLSDVASWREQKAATFPAQAPVDAASTASPAPSSVTAPAPPAQGLPGWIAPTAAVAGLGGLYALYQSMREKRKRSPRSLSAA